MADDAPAPSHADNDLLRVAEVVHAGEISVGFQPGPTVLAKGGENLSPMRSAERRTLERLGLGAGCRMACVSRVQGPVVVDPRPGLEGPTETDADGKPPLVVSADHALRQAIRRVVVVGAGVAGVTAAEEL